MNRYIKLWIIYWIKWWKDKWNYGLSIVFNNEKINEIMDSVLDLIMKR